MKEKIQTIVIETPERFELRFRPAGIGSRMLAYIIDRMVQLGLVVCLASAVIAALYAMPRASMTLWPIELAVKLRGWAAGLAILIYALITIGYFMLFEYFWNGATPGKRTQRIRVIRKDGRPLTFLNAAIRNIMRFVDILADMYPLGLVIMFLDPLNRRLGDWTAGTLVVVETQTAPPALLAPLGTAEPSDAEFRRSALDMSPLDYRLVSEFLARRDSMAPEYRSDVSRQLYTRIFGTPARADEVADPEHALERAARFYLENTRIL
jgi:uncharacterized RDD family membrane protein YckC